MRARGRVSLVTNFSACEDGTLWKDKGQEMTVGGMGVGFRNEWEMHGVKKCTRVAQCRNAVERATLNR